jgi:hypothetical protein
MSYRSSPGLASGETRECLMQKTTDFVLRLLRHSTTTRLLIYVDSAVRGDDVPRVSRGDSRGTKLAYSLSRQGGAESALERTSLSLAFLKAAFLAVIIGAFQATIA